MPTVIITGGTKGIGANISQKFLAEGWHVLIASRKNSELFDRLFDLYEYCYSYSRSKKKNIDFEVGTEEQSGSTNTPYELDYNLKKINNFCKNNNITKPTYVVVQAGTKVMEMQNVGSFESFIRPKNETPVEIQLPKMINICEKNWKYSKIK